MLHLLETSGAQIAVNDNSAGGTAARIAYTSDTDKSVIVLVRSKIENSAGTTVHEERRTLEEWRRFRRLAQQLTSLLAGNQLRTTQQPNGATGIQRLYVLKPDNLGIDLRVSGGGPGGAAAAYIPQDLGQRTVSKGWLAATMKALHDSFTTTS